MAAQFVNALDGQSCLLRNIFHGFRSICVSLHGAEEFDAACDLFIRRKSFDEPAAKVFARYFLSRVKRFCRLSVEKLRRLSTRKPVPALSMNLPEDTSDSTLQLNGNLETRV